MERKSMTRRVFVRGAVASAAFVGMGGLLAGCATNASNSSTAQSDASAVEEPAAFTVSDEVESLKVATLGKDIKIACVLVAKEEGLYEEEKLDVTFETVANLSDGITAVSENKLDVLPFGVIPTCTFVGQGVENVCVFGGTIAEGSECIVLPENKDRFKKIEDFRGAKVGFFPMETGHIVMQALAEKAGIMDEIEWIIYGDSNSAIEGVRKGEFDCAFVNSGGGYIASKSDIAVSMQPGDLKPDFPCCRQTTNFDNLENNKSALIKFMIANLRAYEIIQNDRERAIAALMGYSGQDHEYVESLIYGTDVYDAAMIVEMDPYADAVCDFYEDMKTTENIPADAVYKMEEHVDTTVYRAALDEMIARGENADLWTKLDADFKSHNTIV